MTATGTVEPVGLLLPNGPYAFEPQQYALPSATTHVWHLPAVISVTVLPANVPGGVHRDRHPRVNMLSLPNCAELFSPQQNAFPSATAHECKSPAVIAVTVLPANGTPMVPPAHASRPGCRYPTARASPPQRRRGPPSARPPPPGDDQQRPGHRDPSQHRDRDFKT